MKVRCVCGKWHDVSPTGLAVIVRAFQLGDLQTIGKEGVQSICLEKAFVPERVTHFRKLYSDNTIRFDKERFDE